jgi:hypothetical protein
MRGRLVLGTFAFQAIGALTVIGHLVLENIPQIGAGWVAICSVK